VLTFNSRIILLHLPVEILVEIFSYLPSLSDVICHAAACRHLRLVYAENAKIFNEVAPRTFAYYQRARQLLADGGGPALGEMVSLFYLATMLRNWKIVQTAMAEFELHMQQKLHSEQADFLGIV
jgi:F-box-like